MSLLRFAEIKNSKTDIFEDFFKDFFIETLRLKELILKTAFGPDVIEDLS